MSWPRWLGWPAHVARGVGSAGPAPIVGVGAASFAPMRGAGGSGPVSIAGTGAASFAAMQASGFGNASVPPDIGTPLSTASIFYSGHSLLDRAIAEAVEHIATDRGYANEFQTQMYPASTIYARNVGSGTPSNTATWNGWENGDDRSGGSIDALDEMRNTLDISAVDYSHLIIAENHFALPSLRVENGLKALRAYYETFRSASPSGQCFYYDAWQWIRDPNDLTEWIDCTRQQLVFWEGVRDRINDTLQFAGRSDRIAMLPAGGALADLLHLATTDTVAGITESGDVAATLFNVIQDEDYAEGDVHLNAVGAYFMGCVVYASIYRRSPVGASTMAGVSGTQATSLQNVAWNYVSAYYTGLPYGPRRNNASRLAQANTFCATVGNYYDDPGQIAGNQSFFAASNSNNPIYWSSAADAPSGGWWPFPT